MNRLLLAASAATVVVVTAIVGYNVLPGIGGPGGRATPEPTPVPFSSTPISGALDPGSIVLDGAFPLAIAFDVPAGWTRDRLGRTGRPRRHSQDPG